MNTSSLQQKDNISELARIASELLSKPVTMGERLYGGMNTQVYVLLVDGKKKYVLKYYFEPLRHGKNKLLQEYQALQFLKSKGIDNVPEVIKLSEKDNCAIYEYIPGEQIDSTQVSERDIDQLIMFLKKLKEVSSTKEAQQFPEASEACFSLAQIEATIEKRFERLSNIEEENAETKALKSFLKNDFYPFYTYIKKWAAEQASGFGLSLEDEILKEKRILSPSDFGFHNALRVEKGIVFLDFEHFGWDDPAKMIDDFLLHPAMRLNANSKNRFLEGIRAVFKDDAQLSQRSRYIYPLFGLKWCLILLNEFIASDFNRRAFVLNNNVDKTTLLQTQLAKAVAMLDGLRK